MTTYITYFDYADVAWRHMVASLEDREVAARNVIEASGGTLVAFYWMLGDHDGLAIFEVPEAPLAAGVLAAIAASGVVKGTRTYSLLTSDEARQALTLAKTLSASYQPPGGTAQWRSDYDQLG